MYIYMDKLFSDLQHAALEVFTLLATQSISSKELVMYLSFFKAEKPPLLPLLEPLYHLVLAARPQPYFILSFPVQCDIKASPKFQTEEHKNLEKVENLVNNSCTTCVLVVGQSGAAVISHLFATTTSGPKVRKKKACE